ncbi:MULTISPECIES: hypothetical protein [Actinomycetes]|uniref:hypothetical protein n=1 Tax=Actinomycetes TaxID=1760 RepID=UPI0008D9C004|nr:MULTISPECIES: hypothetical protein [Actinomycetes]
MRDIVKIALVYAVCVLVFQIVFLSDLVWVLFPAAVIEPVLIPVVALLITRKIQVSEWPLNFFVLPLLLYCFGLVADIMAFWISTGGSVFSAGNHILYPVAPDSPSDVKWCGLYGIPAVIFMAGYLIRLAMRKRVACHVSDPNDPSENEVR